MKTRQAFAWFLPLGLAAGLSACGAEQPLPQCTVGRGEHAVRYTLKTGTGACARKKAEVLGAQAFRVPGSHVPPTLAFKPKPLADLEGKDPDSTHSAIASGDFTTEYPNAEGECVVPQMSEARQVVSADPGSTVDLRYQWSNLHIQGRATIPGTQWWAELTYSEGDCTATYEAVGVFPAIRCEKQAPDPNNPGKTITVRDPEVCKQPRSGSSLDPLFPITCEETTNLCVLDGQPPALVH
ncbi:hypothetical protein JRI60_04940 [Archangium violaceum]|uniref:hypothetical protein n=1 Tax=Archangium violaceum TaxID=83451 RepID=UPI001951FEF6|nr:hypothetical protein [Archangium violaceum]QRN98407.1 hypothetical protein JRI60_04940 [Archangium violaceum]